MHYIIALGLLALSMSAFAQMNAAMYGVSDADIDALAHYAAQR